MNSKNCHQTGTQVLKIPGIETTIDSCCYKTQSSNTNHKQVYCKTTGLASNRFAMSHIIGTACIACGARSNRSIHLSMRPSIQPSILSGCCTLLLQVCCCGPNGQEISIDCCIVNRLAASSNCTVAQYAAANVGQVPCCQLM